MTCSNQLRSFVRPPIATVAILLMMLATMPALAQTFQVLHYFTGGLDGAHPYTGLTMDRAGNLYGTAEYGGSQANDCHIVGGCGTVFEMVHQGAGFIFRPLYQFQGFPSGDGANPLGRVILGPDGALFGTTVYGGENGVGCGDEEPGCGTVFKLTPPPTFCKSFTCNWEETQIHNFTGADAAAPSGEIAFDSAGNLYGTARSGRVYELTPAPGTWTFSVLHSFTGGPDGGIPYGGVQLDQAGNVYGTTDTGGTGQNGTAFQLVPSGSLWTLNTLYDFQIGSGGFGLLAGLIIGPGGNLYGGTVNGVPNGDSVVYEISPSDGGWTYTTLYTFTQSFGGGPGGNLVMDAAGNLYGTTTGNSVEQIYGSVFKLTPSNGGWIYTDLHDFNGGSDGGYPYSSIVLDSSGNLYGTASADGHGYGTVWEITP